MASDKPTQDKLTKQELLEWANYLFGRYDAKYRDKKKPLKITVERAIIKLDSKRDKPKK